MNIQIHTCTHSRDLSENFKSFLKTWGYWPYEELRKSMETGHYRLFIVESDEETLAALLVFSSPDAVDVIYIFSSPDYRRHKLASKLLKECERFFKEEGRVEKIFLEVRKDNTPAQKLYESFGMTLIDIRKKYYKDGCDALIYSKKLL